MMKEKATYRTLYFQMFAAMEDALAAPGAEDAADAKALLCRAMARGEEAHMEQDLLPRQ